MICTDFEDYYYKYQTIYQAMRYWITVQKLFKWALYVLLSLRENDKRN